MRCLQRIPVAQPPRLRVMAHIRSLSAKSARIACSALLLTALHAQALPSEGRVDGQILDELERAVPNAKITFYDDARNMCGTTLSDRAGWFASKGLPLRCETVMMVVEASGFARHETDLKLRWFDPQLTTRVRLRSADVVRGRVHSDDGAPIAGATVVASDNSRNWLAEPAATAITDAAGNFTLRGLPLGAGVLLASADGFGMNAVAIRTPSAEPTAVALTAGAGRAVPVTIHNVSNDQVHALWLKLALKTPHGWIARGARQLDRVVTEIGGVPADWSLGASLVGSDPHGSDGMTLACLIGDDATITATVPGPGELVGTVLDPEGKPVANLALKARATLFAGLAITDAEGRFRMRRPTAPHQDVEIFVLSHGYVLRSSGDADTPSSWGVARVPCDRPLQLIADRAPIVRGRVLDAAGKPVPALAVSLGAPGSANHDQAIARSTTDRDGSFEFGRWAIAGMDIAILAGEPPMLVKVGPFRLQAGETKECEARMPAPRVHTFTVRDEQDRLVPGAALTLGLVMAPPYFTDRDGRCVVTCYGMPEPRLLDAREQVAFRAAGTEEHWVLRPKQ
jgi:hypothetical protein